MKWRTLGEAVVVNWDIVCVLGVLFGAWGVCAGRGVGVREK